MTNTPNSGTVSVSRELLERALSCASSSNTSNWSSRLCEDLRALLAQRADQLGEPYAYAYEHDGMVHDEMHPPILTIQRRPDVKEPFTEVALYLHPAPKVDERAEFEKAVQGIWGFPSTQLCLLSGPDLWEVWQARAKLNA